MGATLLAVAGAAVTFAAGLGYARDTARGRVRPNRVTWFVGGLAAWIAFAGQLLSCLLMFAPASVRRLTVEDAPPRLDAVPASSDETTVAGEPVHVPLRTAET